MARSLSDTLASVFVTPAMQNPRCTTLILGAWGTEDPAVDPEIVATKLAERLGEPFIGIDDVERYRLYGTYHAILHDRYRV